MFLDYMDFFHKMHLKNLNLIEKKLVLMMSEINNDLNLDGNGNDNVNVDITNKKYKDDTSTDTDSVSSFGGNGSVIKEKKRERRPRKKDLEITPKINIFFKKKENEVLDEAESKENELMSKEDKFNALVNSIANDVEKLLKSDNIELNIQENKKNKKKKQKK